MQPKIIPLLMLAGTLTAADDSASKPVYIQLFVRATDHVNLDATENRLRRYLAMLEPYQQRQYRPSALILLSGTTSSLLAGRDGANRLLSSLLEASRRGVVEFGYDGAEEPTPLARPRPNFRRANTPEQRWIARYEVAEWFLTEHKHPLTGEPDPNRSGGLKRMQEVFGEAVFLSGITTDLGGDSEVVHYIRHVNRNAIMSGLPEPDTVPARNIEGYRGGSRAFSELVSPDAYCSPELFWMDGVLRLSDSSGPGFKILRADAGPEALKSAIAGLSRSRPRILRIELGHPGMYLHPDFAKSNPSPLRYAYENPKLPRLPANAFRPPADLDAAFGREDASIRWLVEAFLPANAGSRFVSSAGLVRMAAPAGRGSITREQLGRITAALLARWDVVQNHPPEFVLVDGAYFSLSDAFGLLADAMAAVQTQDSVPETVRLRTLYGPLEMVSDQGPPQGSVTVASVARAAAKLVAGFGTGEWRVVPENVIPTWVTIDTARVNAAQFLRLMAQAFSAGTRDTPLAVRTCQMYPAQAHALPRTRPLIESGATWTIKPARLQAGSAELGFQ